MSRNSGQRVPNHHVSRNPRLTHSLNVADRSSRRAASNHAEPSLASGFPAVNEHACRPDACCFSASKAGILSRFRVRMCPVVPLGRASGSLAGSPSAAWLFFRKVSRRPLRRSILHGELGIPPGQGQAGRCREPCTQADWTRQADGFDRERVVTRCRLAPSSSRRSARSAAPRRARAGSRAP
jgi:hypothetical protein